MGKEYIAPRASFVCLCSLHLLSTSNLAYDPTEGTEEALTKEMNLGDSDETNYTNNGLWQENW